MNKYLLCGLVILVSLGVGHLGIGIMLVGLAWAVNAWNEGYRLAVSEELFLRKMRGKNDPA